MMFSPHAYDGTFIGMRKRIRQALPMGLHSKERGSLAQD
jgi:hypothetical protein